MVASDGIRGQALALQAGPHVIVTELLLPRLDGLTLIQRLRRDSRTARTPILILTALHTTADKVRGFESGADDYVTRPYVWEELLVRLRALLRHRGSGPQAVNQPEVLSYGPLTLVPERYEAIWFDASVRLTHIEFELLHCLLQRHGQAVPWGVILKEVWGYGPDEDIECIRTHIRHLRGKLERDRHRPSFLKTIYGMGYCLDLPVEDCGRAHLQTLEVVNPTSAPALEEPRRQESA